MNNQQTTSTSSTVSSASVLSIKDIIIMSLLFLVFVPGMLFDVYNLKFTNGTYAGGFSYVTSILHCALFIGSYYLLKTYVFKDTFTSGAKKLVY